MTSSQNFKVAIYLVLMTSLLYTSYVNAYHIQLKILNNASIYNVFYESVVASHFEPSGFGKMYYQKIHKTILSPGNALYLGEIPLLSKNQSRIQVLVQSNNKRTNMDWAECTDTLMLAAVNSGAYFQFNVNRKSGGPLQCGFQWI